MAGVCWKPAKVKTVMGMSLVYPRVVGFIRADLGDFYLEVVYSMLLFGLDTWVVTPVWQRPWGVSATGWHEGSWRNPPGNETAVVGNTCRRHM